ncbi:tetratricopeptide repeat protein [Kitasatospora cathayae]|uniref:non-specific serine/threonine protein kinase n=1 Tax=Kitasatospora cathayae TaxID=3004092 RepID=A0ABY7Q2Q2_9ACTN|nr:tetratricopeptide repeat protein [Kitasatospora sp. HUAS 3-15]WBP86664.1 protein kinase [Kitasatospora sp. HUAS 3-15]
MGETCVRPDCSGSGRIDADGYCDECGLAPAGTSTAAPAGTTGTTAPPPTAAGPGSPCPRDCAGTIDPDGYCDECGLTPPGADTGVTQPYVPSARVAPDSARSGSVRSLSARTGSARSMSGRSRSHRSTRTGSARSVSVRSTRGSVSAGTRNRLGAGLVTVPTVATADPAQAVLANPEVPERKRYCSKCEAPVGREKNGRPGRPDGFCTKCGTPYSFTPKLRRGDLVGGQYEVIGCLAHGGLGWIYLAVDRRVNDKWVVLKGLLDTGDEDALAAAVAERRFLAEVDHPNIVRIINFAEHPDLRTGSTDGYIVMEFVGGKSLKDIANDRRTPDGRREPLPVEQAIAYALEALPALGYLHARGLVYCDFKIDNVIQSGDTLKIIDMGAVRRLDDDGPIYGTIGYQAPEIATDGPSPASDLYTVARTLAVLTFDFQGYSTTYRDSLPGPEDVEVFARYESYYRFLVRATDPDPARRFSSAEEMADQLTGVLREVLALQDDRPRPAPSTLFGPELRVVDTELVLPTTQPGQLRVAALDPSTAALALPVPRVDPGDPNAGFLATLLATDPEEALVALGGAPAVSIESRLRELRALLELGRHGAAVKELAGLEQDHPDDWRVVWYRGLVALVGATPRAEGRADAEREKRGSDEGARERGPSASGQERPEASGRVTTRRAEGRADAEREKRGSDEGARERRPSASGQERPEASARVTALRAAAEAFDAVYDAFPGEAAPKLALAICAELLGDGGDAAEFYRLVWTTDQAYLSAAFGLARVRLAEDDRPAAVRVLESVPATSSQYTAARIAAVRARLRERPATDPLAADLAAGSDQLTALRLDDRRREELSVEVLGAALGWVGAGSAGAQPGADLVVLGRPAAERELRFALEQSYRVLARLADRAETRIEMVERANRARPRTWV